MNALKKIFVLASAFALVSCVEEEFDVNSEVSGTPVSVYADMGGGRADTRITFDEDDSRVRLGWKDEGESFTGFVGKREHRITFIQEEAPSGGVAKFSGMLSVRPTASELMYAVYPQVDGGTAEAVPFDVSSQDGLEYSEDHTYMYASCEFGTVSSFSMYDLTFKHMFAVINIALNFPDEFEGKTISSIKVNCPGMATAGTIDITGEAPVVKSVASRGSITLSRSGGYPMDQWENVSAYIHFLPANVTNFSVEARIGDELYVANMPTMPEGKEVEAGKKYYFNLKGWTKVESEQKIYHVTTAGTAGGTGYTWDEPTTLSSALSRIKSGNNSGATIYIQNGTYHPDTDITGYTGAASSGATKGWEVTENVTIIGGFPAEDGSRATVLDGRRESYHVLLVDALKNADDKVVLKNLTVTGGKSGDDAITLSREMKTDCNDSAPLTLKASQGSAIAMLSSVVEMENVSVTRNVGTEGTVFSRGTDLTMTNCLISDNTCLASDNAYGADTGDKIDHVAGLKIEANANWQVETVLENCKISRNINENWGQGGLLVYGNKGLVDFTARNCTFSENQGDNGSAIQIQYANFTLDSCTISDNSTPSGKNGKGAIYAYQYSTSVTNIKILNSVISGNSNDSDNSSVGSALYLNMVNKESLTLNCDIINTSIINNVGADMGSYIHNASTAHPLNLTLVNTTMYGNSARQGAALNFHNPEGAVINADLVSCTVTGNTYEVNNAIYFQNDGLNFNAYNTIISGNLKSDGTSVDVGKSSDASGVTPVYKSSIIGSRYYNASGAASSVTPAFAYAAMLDNSLTEVDGTYVVKLKGSSSGENPAIGNGSTLSALQNAVSGSDVRTYASNDQTGAGRSDSYKVMGAYVGTLAADGPVTVKGAEITVMSLNLKTSNNETDAQSEHLWDNRKDAVVAMIKDRHPKIMGIQEVTAAQRDYLAENTGYEIYAVNRGDSEHNLILYDNTVTLGNYGRFWLSETPDSDSNLSWDDKFHRVAIWAVFTMNSTGEKFFWINTHIGLTWTSKKNAIELIVKKIGELNPQGLPTVITGDFNMENSYSALSPLKFLVQNVRETAPVTDHESTYNAWGEGDKGTVDHIFYSGFIPVRYETITKEYAGVRYVSDHYPIMATLQF